MPHTELGQGRPRHGKKWGTKETKAMVTPAKWTPAVAFSLSPTMTHVTPARLVPQPLKSGDCSSFQTGGSPEARLFFTPNDPQPLTRPGSPAGLHPSPRVAQFQALECTAPAMRPRRGCPGPRGAHSRGAETVIHSLIRS